MYLFMGERTSPSEQGREGEREREKKRIPRRLRTDSGGLNSETLRS